MFFFQFRDCHHPFLLFLRNYWHWSICWRRPQILLQVFLDIFKRQPNFLYANTIHKFISMVEIYRFKMSTKRLVIITWIISTTSSVLTVGTSSFELSSNSPKLLLSFFLKTFCSYTIWINGGEQLACYHGEKLWNLFLFTIIFQTLFHPEPRL